MEYILVSAAALIVSVLTFFSGFGLGTLLMPVFAIFFPIEIAIAATAIVHLANNIFKVILVGKHADKKVTIKFALPAALCAFLGAWLLSFFTQLPIIAEYRLFENHYFITPIKALIALLLMVFSLLELIPYFNKINIDKKFIPVGGALSGFFGGLSGHQGALRTIFLLKAGLGKNAFIGTMVLSAVLVDIARLSVYGFTFFINDFSKIGDNDLMSLLIIGSLSAFIGSFFGKYLFDKVTFKSVQIVVEISILIFAIALGMGIV